MKIVFFDYWTKGNHNFLPLNNMLNSLGHESFLFHIGSFNNAQEEVEVIENKLICRDISFYKTKYILKALKIIKPDVILGLNTTYILDRALVLACRSLGIKTIYLMHGDRPTGNEINDSIKNIKISFLDKIRKSLKYFVIVIPNYLLSSWNENKLNIFKLIPLRVLYKTFNDTAYCNYFPPFPEEILYDKCLIYANKYFDYYNKLGYKENQIKVVGNPKHDYLFELIENKFPAEEIKDIRTRDLICSEKKYALYLEDSFQEQGTLNWSYDYLSNLLTVINERLEKENIAMVVKLHPLTNESLINVDRTKILLICSDLEYLIQNSTFCIAHISSTVNIAVILKKPILIPRWGESKYLPDYYVKQGVAKTWSNLDESICLDINCANYEEYIEKNITVRANISVKNIVVNEILK